MWVLLLYVSISRESGEGERVNTVARRTPSKASAVGMSIIFDSFVSFAYINANLIKIIRNK